MDFLQRTGANADLETEILGTGNQDILLKNLNGRDLATTMPKSDSKVRHGIRSKEISYHMETMLTRLVLKHVTELITYCI